MISTPPNIPQGIVEALAASARLYPALERAWLFGSRARGDGAPRADVDIAISMPGAGAGDWLALQELLQSATLLKVDVVPWEEATPEMRSNIMRDGKPLFEKETNA